MVQEEDESDSDSDNDANDRTRTGEADPEESGNNNDGKKKKKPSREPVGYGVSMFHQLHCLDMLYDHPAYMLFFHFPDFHMWHFHVSKGKRIKC